MGHSIGEDRAPDGTGEAIDMPSLHLRRCWAFKYITEVLTAQSMVIAQAVAIPGHRLRYPASLLVPSPPSSEEKVRMGGLREWPWKSVSVLAPTASIVHSIKPRPRHRLLSRWRSPRTRECIPVALKAVDDYIFLRELHSLVDGWGTLWGRRMSKS